MDLSILKPVFSWLQDTAFFTIEVQLFKLLTVKRLYKQGSDTLWNQYVNYRVVGLVEKIVVKEWKLLIIKTIDYLTDNY